RRSELAVHRGAITLSVPGSGIRDQGSKSSIVNRPSSMSFDLLLVGTGFASSFFLLEYLARAPATARVLVLERGWREPRDWQLRERRTSRISSEATFRQSGLARKEWQFTLAFGGGSNCWWACTPRLMPEDFRLRSRHG